MDFKNVSVVCTFDNTQLSLSDLSAQIQQAIQQQFPYICPAVSTLVLVQAAWLNGTFQGGSNQITVYLGVPAGTPDATVATNVAFVISTLFMPLSSTPAVVVSATVTDTQPPVVPGPPNPTTEPTNGNP